MIFVSVYTYIRSGSSRNFDNRNFGVSMKRSLLDDDDIQMSINTISDCALFAWNVGLVGPNDLFLSLMDPNDLIVEVRKAWV